MRVLLILLLFPLAGWAQDRDTTFSKVIEQEGQDSSDFFVLADQWPEFPGGTKAMLHFISENLRYPKAAAEQEVSGRVVVSFIITRDGQIKDIKVLRDIGGDCGEEAVRVVKLMPRWKPGLFRGKPVQVRLNLPIKFDPND